MICFDFEHSMRGMKAAKVRSSNAMAATIKEALLTKGSFRHFIDTYIERGFDAAEHVDLMNKVHQIQRAGGVFITLSPSTVGVALRAVLDPLGTNSPEMMFLGDSLSADSVYRVLEALHGRSTYLYVIADDLKVPEIGANFRVLRQWFEAQYGRAETEKRIFVASPPGSDLHRLAEVHHYDHYALDADFPKEYIAYHPVAYLPFLVAGVDLKEFFNGARMSMHELATETTNPLMDYVIIRWLAFQEGIEVESVCTFEPKLESFCEWRARLRGNDMIYHGHALFLRDLDSLKYYHARYKNKIMETFINVKVPTIDIVVRPDQSYEDGLGHLDNISFNELNNIACDEIIARHRAEGMMINEVQCRRLSAVNMGSLTFFFIAAGILVCAMIEKEEKA
ncbi:MAG: hypothetical protein Q4P30_03905 [Eubacteriales bacterium]|nr:hypothetical protein [Eubacteriales bacterium]